MFRAWLVALNISHIRLYILRNPLQNGCAAKMVPPPRKTNGHGLSHFITMVTKHAAYSKLFWIWIVFTRRVFLDHCLMWGPKADVLVVKVGKSDLGFGMSWARLQLIYPCTFLQNKTKRKKWNYLLNEDQITDIKLNSLTSLPIHCISICMFIYCIVRQLQYQLVKTKWRQLNVIAYSYIWTTHKRVYGCMHKPQI